ncbi:peptidase family M20/M25/M40 [Diaporthe helianthi]|uniref:Peptidase family M20/M25/M40 n=1 Tax=Diaporthe helianthi TaxID=158607 RepID=A0A2P5HQ24_DIAHE|nr:peptidase family M20/M25/M40 [Diaporthe helianthi]
MALISEKLPLMQEDFPAGEHYATPPPAKRCTRCKWVAVPALALLGLCWTNSLPSALSGDQSPNSNLDLAQQCRQVDPLFPGRSSSSLTSMDEYLASSQFLNASTARMSGAIQIATQSYDNMGPIGEDERWDVFPPFADFLERTFPLVHSTLELEKVNSHGLLYTWKGSDVGLKPTVLMAHQDVVPVEKSTVGQWTHPPFSGEFDGKYVWGRGAADDKSSLIGILEAVEQLIDAGFEPKRTVVLSFGFDEEISGYRGAGRLAERLIDRYGKDGASVIVDEGSGLAKQWGAVFALPGVAEKGYIDVDVIVRMPGGHSSIPPKHNGIGVTAELITLIEANQYEPKLYELNPYLGLLQCGAKYAPEFPPKMKKELQKRNKKASSLSCHNKHDKLALEAAKEGDAIKYLFTTSVAADLISGGAKVNALPERTVLTVNHRVNVGEKVSDIQDRITGIAAEVAKKHNLTLHAFTDEAETPSSITLKTGHTLEPAPVSPTEVSGDGSATPYSILSGTTRALYGEDVVVSAGLMTGNTDTKFYWDLTRHIFRYNPGFDPDQNFMDGIHTVDEHMSMKGHATGVQWYSLFLRNMDEADL